MPPLGTPPAPSVGDKHPKAFIGFAIRMAMPRSSKEKAEAKAARKALGLPVRGDAEAGRAKSPYPPKGGRNSGGRGGGS